MVEVGPCPYSWLRIWNRFSVELTSRQRTWCMDDRVTNLCFLYYRVRSVIFVYEILENRRNKTIWTLPNVSGFDCLYLITATYFEQSEVKLTESFSKIFKCLWENLASQFVQNRFLKLQQWHDNFFSSTGFKSILLNIARQWDTKRDQLIESGDKIVDALSEAAKVVSSGEGVNIPNAVEVAKKCFFQLSNSYDGEFGGFSRAPKFPQPGLLKYSTFLDRLKKWICTLDFEILTFRSAQEIY